MDELLNVMRKLRSKSGCKWDRKQTLESLKQCLLEETHEVLDSIVDKDHVKLEEELGDLLCVVLMLMIIAGEKGYFNEKTVLRRAADKMRRRHPHVFGDKKARSAREAYKYWSEAKRNEIRTDKGSILDGVSRNFPALMAAHKIQKLVAKFGFDWSTAEPVLDKIAEEIRELKKEVKAGNRRKINEEIGDMLFCLVNLARKMNMSAEIALLDANEKFRKRFKKIEDVLRKKRLKMETLSLEELDSYWERVKKDERRKSGKNRKK